MPTMSQRALRVWHERFCTPTITRVVQVVTLVAAAVLLARTVVAMIP